MSSNGQQTSGNQADEQQHNNTFAPTSSLAFQDQEPQCCCGDRACAFLADTQAAFDRLDESLRTAGRLGQVSLCSIDLSCLFTLFSNRPSCQLL